jgi:hypothetical protein
VRVYIYAWEEFSTFDPSSATRDKLLLEITLAVLAQLGSEYLRVGGIQEKYFDQLYLIKTAEVPPGLWYVCPTQDQHCP